MLSSMLGTAVQGLQTNQQTFQRHATNISRWGTESSATDGGVDLAREFVGVMQAQRGFEANLAVVRTADEMLGSLIDVLA